MPTSRLVAERRMRSPSVAIRMLARMGRVLRVETAWLTVESPLARSCCLHVIFTALVSSTDARAAYDPVRHARPFSLYAPAGPRGRAGGWASARFRRAAGG